jgi:hypothetical protein
MFQQGFPIELCEDVSRVEKIIPTETYNNVFIFLIADSSYVEIYCKDPLLINIIYDTAKKVGYESLEFIDENDGRTRMSV